MNFRQVHLDFHTSECIPEVGAKFDKKQFQEMLQVGHVNSITVFSKCHHGWAYHPSTANEMHPTLKFDLLQAQIEAAHEIGVKTPVYISAGLDEKMARRHPEWLLRNKDESTVWVSDFRTPGYHRFCFNTGYLEYLLKQVEEVTKTYDADGIFLDIVGVHPCYCQKCVASILKKGKDPLNEDAVLEVAEEVYMHYTKEIARVIHSIKPEMKIFHNSSHIRRGRRDLAFVNTHYELESLPTGGWGYDHFPLSARYVQQLGMEYLGMTGKFHKSWGEFGGYKHPNALKYEVSLSIANGAKLSIGDQLHPSGLMDKATYTLMGSAFAEVEAKEAYCDNVDNIADIGIFSQEVFFKENEDKQATGDVGAVRIMLEGKYLFDMLDMQSDFNKYKLLILPDTILLCDTLKDKINQFMANGGKILATGKSGLNKDETAFALDFGIKYKGASQFNPSYLYTNFKLENLEQSAYVIYSDGITVENEKAEVLAYVQNSYFNRDVFHFCSHQHTPNDMQDFSPAITKHNNCVYIAWDLFTEYAKVGSITVKETLIHAIEQLIGCCKTLKTNLGAQGVVTLMTQRELNRKVCHLLYASPVRRGRDIEIIEDINPIYNVAVKIKADNVKNVYLAPQKENIEFKQDGEYVSFVVKELLCHQMVVME